MNGRPRESTYWIFKSQCLGMSMGSIWGRTKLLQEPKSCWDCGHLNVPVSFGAYQDIHRYVSCFRLLLGAGIACFEGRKLRWHN